MTMRRVGRVPAILVALSAVVAMAWVVPPPQLRILPLGDSITGAPGCWRAELWHRLRERGHTAIDFVGTRTGGACGPTYDRDHAGYSGFQATVIARRNLLPSWLATARPDVVLIHLGTNDLWHGVGTEAVLAAYGKLVEQIRAHNPATRILLAQIIPMAPRGCASCGQRVVALNRAIPCWAAARSTARSPIVVVDQWTGFDPASDTNDGVHPVDSGFRKMAARWLPAVAAALATPVTSPR
ncbi:SGNH/GDSL hydrolase family protein [Crossiella sp. SN42]|uniref:SGNH/GDSL hydrolase family protein n=1 Tax=Crossiella sp. SN42 TaxID=2944808 RepID=UPI00207C2783|nr:SGNH/GDSL hydrolase family protein [Crossiella sp. SN42]MCO1577908.1 SGNH/GDSL hydrolase family protein [Crossiella sp. SN42]